MEITERTIPTIDAKMVKELEAIYQEHLQFPGFPNGNCVRLSHEIAQKFGLTYSEGSFVLDFKPDNTLEIDLPHAWCEDGNMTIVDLTASQFNKGLKNKVPDGVMFLKPEDELYLRYKKIDETKK